jgi:hypothetical protein
MALRPTLTDGLPLSWNSEAALVVMEKSTKRGDLKIRPCKSGYIKLSFWNWPGQIDESNSCRNQVEEKQKRCQLERLNLRDSLNMRTYIPEPQRRHQARWTASAHLSSRRWFALP